MNPGDSNLVRAEMHCGYMDRLLWIGTGPPRNVPRFGGQAYACEMCPGYVASLESVAEGARAYAWWQKGQLELVFPSPTAQVIEACEASHQAWNLYEAEQRARASSPG